jgi:hypothetical protein
MVVTFFYAPCQPLSVRNYLADAENNIHIPCFTMAFNQIHRAL